MFALSALITLGVTACALTVMSSTAIGQDASAGALKFVADSHVTDTAHNFPDGPFGTSLNGQTYQQEALVSFNGYQYAAFYSDPGLLSVGRRKLPEGKWEVIA